MKNRKFKIYGVIIFIAVLVFIGVAVGVQTGYLDGFDDAVYQGMKYIFQRPRPDIALRLIEESEYSFPSGHSMNCLVSYGILAYLLLRYCENRKLAKLLSIGLGLIIILIGLSRVYVGVHFPTDVIGGWSLGIAVLVAMMYAFEKFYGRYEKLCMMKG